MVTDKDILRIIEKLLPALSKTFATKDDLKAFATKDDLKAFATKDDLKELWQKIDNQMVDFRNDTNDRVDAVYKELIAKRDEQSMHTHAHMRQDEKLQDHDLRIGSLESKPLAR